MLHFSYLVNTMQTSCPSRISRPRNGSAHQVFTPVIGRNGVGDIKMQYETLDLGKAVALKHVMKRSVCTKPQKVAMNHATLSSGRLKTGE
jgi:hypothetical protein